MDFLSRHLRTAARKLLGQPAFTLLAVFTLALGIGANAAIFSVVNAVLLRPLPYPESDRLVGVWHTAPGLGIPQFEHSDATYLLYRRANRVFEELGIYRQGTVNLTGGEAPERLASAEVSASILPVLRVTPALGRGILEAEERPGAEPVVVLSHDLWQRRFGAEREVLGRTIRVDGVARTIVGVMPAGFRFPAPEVRLWLPLAIDPADTNVGNFNYLAVARLRPGVEATAAAADLTSLIPRLPEEFGDDDVTAGMLENARMTARVHPLRDDVVGDVGAVLWILLGSVGVILLIACANVANLFLVRAEGRHQELAVRTALGASRRDVAAAFLAESTVLSLLGGALGLALAGAGVRLLLALSPDIPRLAEIGVDSAVLGFTLAVSLAAGLLFGAMPALRSIPDPGAVLKEGGRGAAGGRGRRVRDFLVVSQIALALVLLVGCALMVRSFRELRRVDPGFEGSRVLTLRLSLPDAEYPDAADRAGFYQRVLERVRALPGVEAAGAVSRLPLTGGGSNSAHTFEDFPLEPDEIPPILATRWASPGYFETLGIPLLAGRAFEDADHRDLQRHVVVSAALAERFWPAESALGKRLSHGLADDGAWSVIVGVAGSVRDDGLETEPVEAIYYPLMTPPDSEDEEGVASAPRSLSLAVRAAVAPRSLAADVRRAIWSIDPNLPVANVRAMDEVVADARARTAFTVLLLSIAAGVALVLGAVGLYGVIAYAVSRRTQEIGVRMALGAGRAEVGRMVLRQGLGLAVLGIALGLAGAFAATRLLRASLFEVSPTDPLTFTAVPLLLLAITLAASYLPARRAAAVEPLAALRYE